MGGKTLYLEGEIFRRRLPFSRTKFGKRMGALARRLPALQRHRPITDLKLITRDGRTHSAPKIWDLQLFSKMTL